MEFDVIKTIEERHSVRTYDASRPVPPATVEAIVKFISSLENPLGLKGIYIRLVNRGSVPTGEKLGTYGVIKGASLFAGLAEPDDELHVVAGGYEFESLVLYLTSLGLGTVWLGGTLRRGSFARAMNVGPDLVLPVVTPIGYVAPRRLTEKIMRTVARSDTRRSWEQLFFDGGGVRPLSREEAGGYARALDMVRLAPSASNSQPWRVVRSSSGVFHFFAEYADSIGDMDKRFKYNDLGIAMCHFHLSCKALGLKCDIIVDNNATVAGIPASWRYVFSAVTPA